MKNANFSQTIAALLLTAATVAIAPNATAAESKAVDDIQKTRLAFLENSTKAVDDIQDFRLEQLSSSTKAVDDIQKFRLETLSSSTKAVDDAWGDDFTTVSRPTIDVQF